MAVGPGLTTDAEIIELILPIAIHYGNKCTINALQALHWYGIGHNQTQSILLISQLNDKELTNMKTYNAALELETAAAFEREVKARFDFLCTEHLREQARDEALDRFKKWKISQLAPITINSPKAHKHTSAEPLDDCDCFTTLADAPTYFSFKCSVCGTTTTQLATQRLVKCICGNVVGVGL